MNINKNNFFVVVPFFNEEKWILSTLQSLRDQMDLDFSIILVDNNSSDSSIKVIENYQKIYPDFNLEIITEMQKGTGAAVDTGFKYAISMGAEYIARTDSDCVTEIHWIENIKKRFIEGYIFISGIQKARRDDGYYRFYDDFLYAYSDISGSFTGNLVRRNKDFKYRFMLVPGNNMALTKDLYLKSGGFTRSKIEDIHEDTDLSERIRKLTSKVIKDRKIITYTSMRRIRKWGYIKSFFWYWDHKYKPKDIDIR